VNRARGDYGRSAISSADGRVRSNFHQRPPYPVIDIFAGPGGLGEGFASLQDRGRRRFRSAVAIERDEFSHRTLLLRHFVRQFPDGEAPDDYYAFLAGRVCEADLFARYPDAHREAQRSALRISLGSSSHSHEHRGTVADGVAIKMSRRAQRNRPLQRVRRRPSNFLLTLSGPPSGRGAFAEILVGRRATKWLRFTTIAKHGRSPLSF